MTVEKDKETVGGIVPDDAFRWKSLRIGSDVEEIDVDLLNEVRGRIEIARERMMKSLCADLFSGEISDYVPPPPPTRVERLKAYILSWYYFFKCRIVGIYEVLRYGETQNPRWSYYDD